MDASVSTFTNDRIRNGESGLMPLPDSADALLTRVLAARSARTKLDLMYYLWHDDQTGRALLGEVVKAADRGVKVRLLLDDINPRSTDAAYVAINSHPNIELKLFNPSHFRNSRVLKLAEFVWRRFKLTRRMHLKAWIADGDVAIVGGRNIGDAYFDVADTNFRDLDMLLLGPAVEQTFAIFEAFWNAEAAIPISKIAPVRAPRAEIRKHIDSRSRVLEEVPDWPSMDGFLAQRGSFIHWTRTARVIADPPEKVARRRRKGWLARQLLPIIRASHDKVEIVSPYFIPGVTGTRTLRRLVQRGVDVTVLTNSLAATDVAAVHGAYANYRRRLLKAGVKLFELQPFQGHRNLSILGSKGASLHTKAFLVDQRIGFVGSFNFDPRSVALNAEMGVLFEDPVLAEEVARWFEREKSPELSYRVLLSGRRLIWEGVCNNRFMRLSREPEASLWRRILARLVGLLPVESEL